MNLEQLQSLALQNNPTLIQATMQVRAAQGRLVQAGLYPNPVAGYQAEEIGDEGTAGQQGAFFGQTFIRGGKLSLAQAAAQHEIHAAQHACRMQERRVLNEVSETFYSTLAAQQIVALSQRLVALSEEGAQVAEQLFAAQEVARTDVLQAQIEAENTQMQSRQEKNRLEAAWRRLASLAGKPNLHRVRLEGVLDEKLPEFQWEDSLARLLGKSPELAIAREKVRRARSLLQRACAERAADVEATASVRYNAAAEETIASLGVGVPIKVFDRNQGNISRAQAELISAEREVGRVELSLQNRLAAAFEQYANARSQAESYAQNILPRAEESLELVQTSYRQGQIGYLTLLTAQRTYFQASVQYLHSLRDLHIAVVAMEGLLLEGGLEPPMQVGGAG